MGATSSRTRASTGLSGPDTGDHIDLLSRNEAWARSPRLSVARTEPTERSSSISCRRRRPGRPDSGRAGGRMPAGPSGSVPPMLRMSTLFLRTLRDDPADAEVASHRLLVRAGYIRRAAPGGFTWLPLGWIVYRNVERIVREEMDAAGFQEVHFPALLPREPYEATGRWTDYGDNLFRLKDRRGNDFLLAPTHEEMFTLLVKDLYASYKDLPLVIYQIQTKYRDEARPAAGLLRGREFVMKDSYSFDIDDAGLERSYQRHRDAYIRTFDRLGLPYVIVSAMSGAMGGSASEEFLAPLDVGEDTFVRTASGDYAANVEAVRVPVPADGAVRRRCRRPSSTTRRARRRSPRSSTTSTRATTCAARDRDVDGGRHAEERHRQAAPPRRHDRAAGHRRARRPRRRPEAARGRRSRRPSPSRSPRRTSPATRRWPRATSGPARSASPSRTRHPLPRRPAGRRRHALGHRRRRARAPRRRARGRARLHARRRDRGRRGARRRPLPDRRRAAGAGPRHRDRPHLPARPQVRRGARPDRARPRRQAGRRHDGLVRHRRVPGRGGDRRDDAATSSGCAGRARSRRPTCTS